MNKVVKIDKVQPAITPMEMLNLAVNQGADLDKLEKLMDLQQRWESSEGKKAFSAAMAGFQSQLGTILKTRVGHNSNYADIDDIAKAIRPALDDAGLSYRFEQSQEALNITVVCIITHSAGHSEQTRFTAGADTSGGKNAIQSLASTVSYLRRYTLTGALGITTASDDNDGGRPSVTTEDLLQYNNLVRDEFFSISAVKQGLLTQDYSAAKEAWHEMDQETQHALWKAPTKGGVFTTIERGLMKSPEWIAAE